MGLKRSAKAIRGRGANIFTQWVGDPDALGSAVLLKAILAELGATGGAHPHRAASATRRTATSSSAAGSCSSDPNDASACRGGLHCMVDTSPPARACRARPGSQPVTRLLLRGRPPRRPRRGGGELPRPRACGGCACLRRPARGLDLGVHGRHRRRLRRARRARARPSRAAAALGIYTDTSALLHGATPLDFKMFELLTRDEETQDILDELRDYRVPARVVPLPGRRLPQPGGDGRRCASPRSASCATSTAT